MPGAHRIEVATIHGRDVSGPQPLSHSNHRGIRATQGEAAVLAHELGHPGDVRRHEIAEFEGTARAQRVEERRLRSHPQMPSDEVARLGRHRRRYQERHASHGQPPHARQMMTVPTICERIEHPGIDDDHDM